MSQEEISNYPEKVGKRVKIFDLLSKQAITPEMASEELTLSLRQTRRIAKRYKTQGIQGLYSKKVGQVSNNQYPLELQDHFLQIVSDKYRDFGPTFAHEKLTEYHSARFSIETLRKWMITARLWTPHLKAKQREHPLRERRSCIGALVQIDGSKHLWFEERGGYSVLLVAIDDASSKILSARFVPVENAENYLRMFKEYFKEHGFPASLYSNKHGIFRVNAQGCEDNETQFKRIVNGLGIELIPPIRHKQKVEWSESLRLCKTDW